MYKKLRWEGREVVRDVGFGLQSHPRAGGILVRVSGVYQSPLLVGVVGEGQQEGELCVSWRSIGLCKGFMVSAVGYQVRERYPAWSLWTAS